MNQDPWNWSVQDVQQFFKTEAASYIADMPHGRLPDLDPFLKKINDNGIHGAILLTILDAASLRDDCGVTTLGVRGAVMHCIAKLRRQSAIYSAQNGIPLSPLDARVVSPITPQVHVLASTERFVDQLRSDEYQLQDSPSRKRLLSSIATPRDAVLTSMEGIGEHVRSGEYPVHDAAGRKRRRLNLSTPSATTAHPAHKATSPGGLQIAQRGFLGISPCPIDELFFGQTKTGHNVGKLEPVGDVLVLDADREAHLGDHNFQFLYQGKALGEAQYVYSKVLHFQRSIERVNLRRRDRDAIGLIPHRDIGKEARSAIVIQFRDGVPEPVAVREDATHILSGHERAPFGKLHSALLQNAMSNLSGSSAVKETASYVPNGHDPDSSSQSDLGQWGYLVQKYKATEDDEVLPLWKDSEYGSEDIAAEAKEYEAEDKMAPKDLSPYQVSNIIDKYIANSISEWKSGLPELERKNSRTVWKQMKDSRTRPEVLIHDANARIEHLTRRLNSMKEEISSSTWRKEQKLKKACDALELTVEEREEQRWKISVWKRRKEPAHTPRLIIRTKKVMAAPPPGGPTGQDDIDLHVSEDERTSISSSSEEQELPDLSTLVKPVTRAKSQIEPIDLTMTSDESSPPPRIVQPKTPTNKLARPPADPYDATGSEVRAWDYSVLAKEELREPILIKLLLGAGPSTRDGLDEFVRKERRNFLAQLRTAVHSLHNDDDEGTDLREETAKLMMECAEIFMQWYSPTIPGRKTRMLDEGWLNSHYFHSQMDLFARMLVKPLLKKDTKLFRVD